MIDPLRLAKEAFEANDAELLGLLLNKYPQLKEVVNQPIGPFDSPAIRRHAARSAARERECKFYFEHGRRREIRTNPRKRKSSL